MIQDKSLHMKGVASVLEKNILDLPTMEGYSRQKP